MAGRRSAGRLTPEVQDRIVNALRAGNYVETAASLAGVGRASIYRWLDRGRSAIEREEAGETLSDDDQRYAEFAHEVDEARASAMARNVTLVNTAAQTTWQAAAWWLERTNPQMWGRHLRAEVSGPDQGPIQVAVQRDALIDRIVSLLNEGQDEPPQITAS
jgi:transposase